ncbi:MAG TPA: EAL domain-containing protein [Kofleriaceae bacterium]
MREAGSMGFDVPTVKMNSLRRTPSVETAIDQGLVQVELQPVIDLATGRTFGYESLARCKLEALASPAQLFATAIEQGSLAKLGRELRRRSVEAMQGAAVKDVTLFLNLHPAELDLQDVASAGDPLATYPGKIVIEVPESSPILRYRFASTNLDTLRRRGAQIALDDFGAGYSNFGYIAQLNPDIVKLDRELIAGVRVHSKQWKLIQSLNALCGAQGATVIAEGVETRDELAAVIAAGIPLAQGYYLGRPSVTGTSTWTPS